MPKYLVGINMFTWIAGALSFIPGKWKIYGGIAVILTIVGGGGYLYIQYIEAQLESERQKSAAMESALKETRQTVERMQKNQEALLRELNRLDKEFNRIDKETAQLEKLLSEHDLENLANEKPGLIENRINKGTKGVLKDFEDLTDPESFNENN